MTAPHTEDSRTRESDSLSGFVDWARADKRLNAEWTIDRLDAKTLVYELDAARALRAELQEVERERERYREALERIADPSGEVDRLMEKAKGRGSGALLPHTIARAALKGEV